MRTKYSVTIICISLLLFSCASFDPLPFTYNNPIEDNSSMSKDSIFISVKILGDPVQGDIYLDDENFEEDNINVTAVKVSISNRKTEDITYETTPLNLVKLLSEDEVRGELGYSRTATFIGWTFPWIVNLAFGLPVYYGLGWPIIGLIASSRANTANNRLERYLEENRLTKIVKSKKTVNGLLFFSHRPKELGFIFQTKDSTQTKILIVL